MHAGQGVVEVDEPAFVLFHVAVLSPVLPKVAQLFVPAANWDPKFDPTNDLYGWDQLAVHLEKIRKDREVLLHLTPYPKMLILGKKDPVLIYETTLEQIEDTAVKLITLPDGHMSHIENRNELKDVLLKLIDTI